MYSNEERLKMRAEYRRAFERSRLVLKSGDRITYTSCPGTKRWGIFDHFGKCGSARTIHTKTRDDVSAGCITKVNGRAVDFTDAGGIPLPPDVAEALTLDEINDRERQVTGAILRGFPHD